MSGPLLTAASNIERLQQELSTVIDERDLALVRLSKCRAELDAINEIARVAFMLTTDALLTDWLSAIGFRCKEALEETK